MSSPNDRSWEVAAPEPPAVRGPFARFGAYLWRERAWWMVPMALTLVALFTLVWFASHQQVAPFFYAVGH